MATTIEVHGLKKIFSRSRKAETFTGRLRQVFRPDREDFEAVRGIDFKIQGGETVAFIGPNGAGKSTTIKILTGILHPTSGSAEILGYTPWKQRQRLAFEIGSVFGQKSQLWLHLPPMDTFELLSRIYEMKRADYRARRDELIKAFDLGEFVHTPTRKLSLGQRMRCEVAASLLHRPKVIFLDEPTIGLDPIAKASIRELISKANREDGVTVFLTSHDAGDIERLCRRVIVVHHGRIVFDDSTNRLKREFLRRKEIDLKLAQPWERAFEMPGVQILKAREFGLKLSVDTDLQSIERVVSGIVARGGVEDILIQNPPMEEIITDIYRRQEVGP